MGSGCPRATKNVAEGRLGDPSCGADLTRCDVLDHDDASAPSGRGRRLPNPVGSSWKLFREAALLLEEGAQIGLSNTDLARIWVLDPGLAG